MVDVVLMQKIVLFFITCSVLLAAPYYTIQLMSYKKEDALPSDLKQKVQRSGLEYRIFEENGYNKLVLGRFKTRAEALHVKRILKCVPMDAFVRIWPETHENEHIALKLHETIDDTNSSLQEKQVCAPCVVVEDPKALHRAQMEQAIEYFKNSGYYRFDKH